MNSKKSIAVKTLTLATLMLFSNNSFALQCPTAEAVAERPRTIQVENETFTLSKNNSFSETQPSFLGLMKLNNDIVTCQYYDRILLLPNQFSAKPLLHVYTLKLANNNCSILGPNVKSDKNGTSKSCKNEPCILSCPNPSLHNLALDKTQDMINKKQLTKEQIDKLPADLKEKLKF